MKNTHLLASLALGLALSVPAMADDHRNDTSRMDRMAERLELTSDQREQIQAGMSAYHPELRALRSEMREQRRAMRQVTGVEFDEAIAREIANRIGEITAESTYLRARVQAHMQSVLTDEQLETLREGHGGYRQGKGEYRGGKGRWQRHRHNRG